MIVQVHDTYRTLYEVIGHVILMEILVLWEKHGSEAAIEIFGVKRRTLFDWKKKFERGGKKLKRLMTSPKLFKPSV